MTTQLDDAVAELARRINGEDAAGVADAAGMEEGGGNGSEGDQHAADGHQFSPSALDAVMAEAAAPAPAAAAAEPPAAPEAAAQAESPSKAALGPPPSAASSMRRARQRSVSDAAEARPGEYRPAGQVRHRALP